MRKLLVLLGGILVLVAANVSIYRAEDILANGRTVLLELAPVDPRSLMQGDYMALRFKVSDHVAAGESFLSCPKEGALVIGLDKRDVGAFKRVDDGRALASDEVRIRYHIRGSIVTLATNAYFFQEGHARDFNGARYGELRVGTDGHALLAGLRNERLLPLESPPPR